MPPSTSTADANSLALSLWEFSWSHNSLEQIAWKSTKGKKTRRKIKLAFWRGKKQILYFFVHHSMKYKHIWENEVKHSSVFTPARQAIGGRFVEAWLNKQSCLKNKPLFSGAASKPFTLFLLFFLSTCLSAFGYVHMVIYKQMWFSDWPTYSTTFRGCFNTVCKND